MTNTAKWYLNVAISLCLMIFIRFIPAPEPMTQLGMTVLGIFLGAIYGWCTTNLFWPSMAALVMFGFTGFTTPTGAWATLISNGTVALALWLMIAVGLLNNTGLTQYLANWSITRKFTQGKPWVFITVVYIAAIACSAIVHCIGTILVFWPLLWTIAEQVGWKKGDKTPAWMSFSIVLLTTTASFIMPFQIAVVSNFGFLAAGSGGAYDGSFNYSAYLTFTLIIQAVILLAYMLCSRFIFKIDLTNLATYVPENSELPKFSMSQKVGLGLFVALFLLLMAPSFLPKGTSLQAMASTLNSVGACLVIVAIACCIRIEGKPFVEFSELVNKNVNWGVIMLMGTALTLATCVNNEASGIIPFVSGLLAPVLGGLSPYMFVIVFMAIALVITNLINNVVVSAIMVPVSWTFSTALGLNPIAVVACFILFVDFAIFLPSASPSGAMMHSSEGWIPKLMLYKFAFVALIVLFVVSIAIGWPLSNMLLVW